MRVVKSTGALGLVLAALVALSASLALSGCSGSSTVSAVVDPVAQAANTSGLAPGFRATVTQVTGTSSSEVSATTVTDTYDQRAQRGAFNMSIRLYGNTFQIEGRYSPQAIFMRLPAAARPHGWDKRWIKVDLEGLGIGNLNFSSLHFADPGEWLGYLKAVKPSVARLGADEIAGVPTTHYRATIDYSRYVSLVPASQRAAARARVTATERITGSRSQLVNVWVDQEHRIRREELTYQGCRAGIPGKLRFHTTIEFTNFGIQVVPAQPPAREVLDVTSAVAPKVQQRAKAGCS
jgi:hypothetical protein